MAARVLGSAAYVWCESAGKDEWVLHVDPPLEAGGTIEIDCWMPFDDRWEPEPAEPGMRSAGVRSSGGRFSRSVRSATADRSEFAGPAIGRAVSISLVGSRSDQRRVVREGVGEASRRAAYALRDEAIRARVPRLAFDRRAPRRLSVKPTVQLQFEPGRVVMTVEAELSEPSGRFGQIEGEDSRWSPDHRGQCRGAWPLEHDCRRPASPDV